MYIQLSVVCLLWVIVYIYYAVFSRLLRVVTVALIYNNNHRYNIYVRPISMMPLQNECDDGYRCECGEGYSGTHCEQTDFCVVHSLCQNGGNCTMVWTNTVHVCTIECNFQNTIILLVALCIYNVLAYTVIFC